MKWNGEASKALRRFEMRRAILAALTASGLVALFAVPAEAVGTRYPFCIQGDEYPGLSNCTFTSYEQCQATASGRFLSCIANPYFVGESEPPSAGYRPLRGRTLPPAPAYGRY
jgi:hypothetical protein